MGIFFSGQVRSEMLLIFASFIPFPYRPKVGGKRKKARERKFTENIKEWIL